MMRSLVFMIALFLSLPRCFADVPVSFDAMDEAIKVYQAALDETDRDRRVQSFRRAESLFEAAIRRRQAESDQSPSADAYVNLGNAALGAERLGPAILAYRRALADDSNHRRARQNLEHARTLLPIWVPVPEDDMVSFGSLFDWARVLDREDWRGIAAITFFLAMLSLAIHLRTGRVAWRHLTCVALLIWIASLAWLQVGMREGDHSVAVVIVPEIAARAADSVNAPARFREPLPGGTELLIVEERDEWVRVQLFDSREAWLPLTAIDSV